jgi:hypothetical protein
MDEVLRLLESQQDLEKQFAAEATSGKVEGPGWSPALLFFHIYGWRKVLVGGLEELQSGRHITPPPDDVDEHNDRELRGGAAVSLHNAARAAQETLGRLIALWNQLGDRPFNWYMAETTGRALLRNSYLHPRNHLAEHFIERGDRARGHQIFERTASELRRARVPGHTLAPALYNLACVRVAEGRNGEAIKLLEEAIPLRSDIAGAVAGDKDLEPLRKDPRFKTLVGG